MGRTIITVINHLTFTIAVLTGMFALRGSPFNRKNLLFFALCLSTAFWAFFLGLANATDNMATAVVFRRLGSIGWGTAFVFILHFFFTLAEEGKRLPRGVVITLYSVAAVNILLYGLITPIAELSYVLEMDTLGWINTVRGNPFDLFYNVYHYLFLLAAFYILFRWSRRQHQIRGYFVLGSFVFFLVLSKLYYPIALAVFGVRIPSVEPVALLLSCFIFYRHAVSSQIIEVRKMEESSVLLSGPIRRRLFTNLGFIFMLTSGFVYLNFLAGTTESLPSVMIGSGAFLLVGTAIYLIPFLNIRPVYGDLVLTITMVLSLVQFVLRLEGRLFATNFLWFLPIFYLIIATLFDSRYFSWTILAGGLFFQGAIWYADDGLVLTIGPADHIARMSFLILSFAFLLYIRRQFENRRASLLRANVDLQLAREIVNQTAEAVCVSDLQGMIIDANDSFSVMTQYSREELIGASASIFVSDLLPHEFFDEITTTVREGGAWSGEVRLPRKDGQELPLF